MRSLFLLLCVFSSYFGISQTIVNAYAKVTGISTSGGVSVLSLSNVNQVNHTFSVGGVIIIMQMQDNVIGNTANAPGFGNLGGIQSAGLYESAAIAAMSGAPNSITLTTLLSNAYNINGNASVQIITLRNLGANYTTTNNISGLAWDGSVGGVLAIEVTNTLTLNHSISMDGRGFRGGAVSVNAPTDYACTNTYYSGNNTQRAGYKGEGIYAVTSATQTNGRGRMLNGGGAGAENNTGGGGGGNFTGGGVGGKGWTCSLTPAPSNSGRGLGAITLSNNISVSRIFMGGGGGGGQQNNNEGRSGSNGGGIILIKANTLATGTCTSPIRISANGIAAVSSGQDGAGGGGGGGSIVIHVNSFSIPPSCTLSVLANGGNGGNVNHFDTHGGGGGGGQGALIYSSAFPTVNVTNNTLNGLGGYDNNVNFTVTAGNGQGNNNAGVFPPIVGSVPLPVKLIGFKGEAEKDKIKLTWKTASEKNNNYFVVEKSTDGTEFTETGKVNGAGNSSIIKTYSLYDYFPSSGINYYRLKQVNDDGTVETSSLIYVNYDLPFDFSVFPNPADKENSVVIECDAENAERLDVYVLNLTGKQLAHHQYQKSNKLEVDIKSLNLERGIYLLKIQIGNQNKIKKLCIE